MSSSNNLFLKSFPPLAFLRMPAVGLDISHRSIRFVELARSFHGLYVRRFGEQNFAASLAAPDMTPEDLGSNKELPAALAALKHDFKLSFVNVSLPEDQAFIFTLSLPHIEDAKLREAIEFQLEENVPLPPSEVLFDFVHIPAKNATESKAAELSRVVVTAFPKKIIEDYRKLFADAGLIPLSFTLQPEAVAAAVVPKGNIGTILIVNIGTKKTGIYVVVDGVLQFASTLSFGGEALTAAVAKHFDVSLEEAEKIKRSESFLKRKNTMQLFFSMSNSVSGLSDEIARVAAYWQTHKGAVLRAGGGLGDDGSLELNLIDKIILCGRDAHLAGLDQYLATTLSLPVSVANVWTNAFSFDNFIPKIHLVDSLDYAAAAGLSLETLHSQ